MRDVDQLVGINRSSRKEIPMRKTRAFLAAAFTVVLSVGTVRVSIGQNPTPKTVDSTAIANVAVGPQYDSTHVYVVPEDFDRFVASLLATFGGTTAKKGVADVTPTPSSTITQVVHTPAGGLSVFGFTTPIPYPFGAERTGYLVTDMDEAIRAARAAGADIIVAPFNDAIGRDAVIQWPGGINTQLYWHTTVPSYTSLQTIPENRVYVSPDAAAAFLHSFMAFAHGEVVSDEVHAAGVEIGRPNDTYRRIRIQSTFGKLSVLVTDGLLPYPYGREMTGYEVANLAETVAKAKAAGVEILVAPYVADGREETVVKFPGGYIAEIHAPANKQSKPKSEM
jgi:predicted enzyme related to lactoylglutathione lyase